MKYNTWTSPNGNIKLYFRSLLERRKSSRPFSIKQNPRIPRKFLKSRRNYSRSYNGKRLGKIATFLNQGSYLYLASTILPRLSAVSSEAASTGSSKLFLSAIIAGEDSIIECILGRGAQICK